MASNTFNLNLVIFLIIERINYYLRQWTEIVFFIFVSLFVFMMTQKLWMNFDEILLDMRLSAND